MTKTKPSKISIEEYLALFTVEWTPEQEEILWCDTRKYFNIPELEKLLPELKKLRNSSIVFEMNDDLGETVLKSVIENVSHILVSNCFKKPDFSREDLDFAIEVSKK